MNTLSLGGTKLTGVTTAEACMEECRKLRDCAGFDYNIGDKECYYHKDGFEKSAKTEVELDFV